MDVEVGGCGSLAMIDRDQCVAWGAQRVMPFSMNGCAMFRFCSRSAALVGVVLAASLGTAAGAAAQDTSPARGQTIAQTWCVECHAISEGNQPSALADAPPFHTLAARPDFGVETVRRALLLPHPVMPDFPVTDADIEALAAYIGTLSPDGAPVEEQRTEKTGGAPTVLVAASGSGIAAKGEAIVAENCSPCHLIAGQGQSPVADAPAFSTLSQRYPVEYLAEALAEGIMVGHETVQMPTFVFEPDEVDAILAYLQDVQE